jgi:hypothetical protein
MKVTKISGDEGLPFGKKKFRPPKEILDVVNAMKVGEIVLIEDSTIPFMNFYQMVRRKWHLKDHPTKSGGWYVHKREGNAYVRRINQEELDVERSKK